MRKVLSLAIAGIIALAVSGLPVSVSAMQIVTIVPATIAPDLTVAPDVTVGDPVIVHVSGPAIDRSGDPKDGATPQILPPEVHFPIGPQLLTEGGPAE